MNRSVRGKHAAPYQPSKGPLIAGIALLAGFILLSIALTAVDVQPIGPLDSRIGLASINGAVFTATGTSALFDTLSDGLLVLSILAILGYGILGIKQLIQRKSLSAVDRDLYLFAALCVVLLVLYIAFDALALNYRPILDDGELKPSFPSSHTLLIICIAAVSFIQAHNRIDNDTARKAVQVLCIVIIGVAFVGRILSGAHWFTDVVGGLLLGLSLACLYHAACERLS